VVVEIDAGGRFDVLIAVGCYGALYAFDGMTGAGKKGQLGRRGNDDTRQRISTASHEAFAGHQSD